MKLFVFLKPAWRILGEIGERIGMPSAERQDTRQIMFKISLLSVTGFTSRYLRNLAPMNDLDEFACEHVVSGVGGTFHSAIDASLSFESLAHFLIQYADADYAARRHSAYPITSTAAQHRMPTLFAQKAFVDESALDRLSIFLRHALSANNVVP